MSLGNSMFHLTASDGPNREFRARLVEAHDGRAILSFDRTTLEYPNAKRAVRALGGMVEWERWTDHSKEVLLMLNDGARP